MGAILGWKGGRGVRMTISTSSFKFTKKRGATAMESGPQYILFAKFFFIFSRKLQVIFCIVCTLMLHNLHRTSIPH